MEQRLRSATSWLKLKGAVPKSRSSLEVDPVEADTVRLIFKLYLHGDGQSRVRLGSKRSSNGSTARAIGPDEAKPSVSDACHKILTNTVYIGQWKFNKTSSRTGQSKPDEEIVDHSPFPAIIESVRIRTGSAPTPRPQSKGGGSPRHDWADPADGPGGVRHLHGRDDACAPAHQRTGSFTATTRVELCARKGKTVCKGSSIRMDKLDGLVTDHLVERFSIPNVSPPFCLL